MKLGLTLSNAKDMAVSITRFALSGVQVEKAAQAAGKEPVLVYKYDRQPITVVMRLEYLMGDGAHHDEKMKMEWDAFTYMADENWDGKDNP